VTAVRVEGPAPSAEHRCQALRKLLAGFGAVEELHGRNSGALWRELRDAAPFAAEDGRVVWRLSVPPAQGAQVAAQVNAAEVFYDWGGGLVWLALAPGSDGNDGGDGGAARVRAAVAQAGGHATLVRADAGLRGAEAVFQPQDPALAALTARVKESFDPRHILNPGRMYGGV
jgi:glycolate oxidase FAD binding subunit